MSIRHLGERLRGCCQFAGRVARPPFLGCHHAIAALGASRDADGAMSRPVISKHGKSIVGRVPHNPKNF